MTVQGFHYYPQLKWLNVQEAIVGEIPFDDFFVIQLSMEFITHITKIRLRKLEKYSQ